MARILVIEDNDGLRLSIRETLTDSGHAVDEAAALRDARRRIGATPYDLLLLDVNLGRENALPLIAELRADGFDGSIAVMTNESNLRDAVRAMQDGANDYLSKPLSMEGLALQVEKWIEHRRLARRVELYERIEQSRRRDSDLIGQSPRWKATLALADRLSSLPLGQPPTAAAGGASEAGGAGLPCILITGETGVGKGALARYIHRQAAASAPAATGRDATEPPFVHVNCSALPATLVEGELFGHEKGAFTDAREARPGLFEMADGGTIFLDEISEMPLELQSKLLLVVEHGSFRRVGGTKERHVRVRVIAASNQNLDERVKAGSFRRDLLYRLNAFVVRIPPLRERTGDAAAIGETTLERLTRRYARPTMTFSDAARAAIASHDWPGNVRELVNSVQRAVMLCDCDVIEPADLGLGNAGAFAFVPEAGDEESPPAWGSPEPAPAAVRGRLVFDFENGPHRAEDVERELIMQALKHTHGNVSRAAKLIGMQRSSLRYRIERYHLETFIAEVASR